jgi:hypothetical protein
MSDIISQNPDSPHCICDGLSLSAHSLGVKAKTLVFGVNELKYGMILVYLLKTFDFRK